MFYAGRLTAGAASAGAVMFTAGFGYWAANGNGLLAASAGAALSAAIALPAGWLLGRKYDRLKTASAVDFLTGVHTRGFIEETATKLLKRASRGRKKITVIVIDVNEFKEINDIIGHHQGDIALRFVARSLKDCSEHGEIVGRWGGDEFIMICPYADDKQVERLFRSIQDRLHTWSQQVGLPLTVSAGCACFPEHGGALSQLVQRADKKMYDMKHSPKRIAAEAEVKQA